MVKVFFLGFADSRVPDLFLDACPVYQKFQFAEKFSVAAIGEEVFQHTHVQEFPEPSGACKGIYFSPVVKKFCDQSGFIYIV